MGWVGILLPFVLLAGYEIFGSGALPDSISGYYYTVTRNIFVAALCLLGAFLAGYKGYDGWDNGITNLAGVFAIGVALCPTKPPVPVLTTTQNVVGDLHLGFATVMFLALAVMSFRFCKAGPASRPDTLLARVSALTGLERQPRHLTPRKRERNIVYRTCGAVILACILLAVVLNFLPTAFKSAAPWLFVLETFAVLAFGLSWLVKGQTLLLGMLKDKKPSPSSSL
jgi:hypothetical protein